MGKYLRYIACQFTDADGRVDQGLCAAVRAAPETRHLPWMYEHYATPMRSDGVAKVNLFLTAAELNREPNEVLEIADVYEHFDAPHFLSLPPDGRQQYFLDRIHSPLMRCAKHFGWDAQPLTDARNRIVEESFQFSFFWKKPLASPDRRTKVQAFVQASPFPARLHLVFFDMGMQELRRTLLSEGTDGPGPVEFALGAIQWIDSQTVRVRHTNNRDYWLCTIDGTCEYHFPRAQSGDPRGEYDLGRMYFEGRVVLQDRERGLGLIRGAAEQGYTHAVRFLDRLERSGEDELESKIDSQE